MDVSGDLSAEVIGGKYRILGTLGVGGSGTVYRAQLLEAAQRQVALKLMHAEHPEGDIERQRFAREAEMVKKLHHPHIVELLDYGHSEDGVPFLVFPLLSGQSLERKLKRDGALGDELTGRYAVQVLHALERAHAMDVAHRDIKPANIFLCEGSITYVQLLDFGLAKVMGNAGLAEVTRAGAVVGTPRYMAPEQVRGEQVGPTADIYSLGLVMAEMLTGEPVVDAETELDIYVLHGSDKPLKVPDAVKYSPFGAIIQRAVAKPLKLRYRKASQMLADVRAAIERMGGSMDDMVVPDMEATHVIDPSNVVQLSLPTEMSEKLREAFNVLAHKTTVVDEAVPSAAPTLAVAPDDRPTVPRAPLSDTGMLDEITADMAPAPQVSIPIALHRRKPRAPPADDSAATLVRDDAHGSSRPPPLPAIAPATPLPPPQHISSLPPTTSSAPHPSRNLAAELLVDPSADLDAVGRRHQRIVVAVFVALLFFAIAAGLLVALLSS